MGAINEKHDHCRSTLFIHKKQNKEAINKEVNNLLGQNNKYTSYVQLTTKGNSIHFTSNYVFRNGP